MMNVAFLILPSVECGFMLDVNVSAIHIYVSSTEVVFEYFFLNVGLAWISTSFRRGPAFSKQTKVCSVSHDLAMVFWMSQKLQAYNHMNDHIESSAVRSGSLDSKGTVDRKSRSNICSITVKMRVPDHRKA